MNTPTRASRSSRRAATAAPQPTAPVPPVPQAARAPRVPVSDAPTSMQGVDMPAPAAGEDFDLAAASAAVNGDPRDEHAGRAPRVPFGNQAQKLTLPERPGYKRRWFKDLPGRIDRARAAWWEHIVDQKTGKPVSMVTGVNQGGGGEISYAMEIPAEFYEQDFAAQQSLIDEFDQALLRGENANTKPGTDGRYVPLKPDNTPRIEVSHSR